MSEEVQAIIDNLREVRTGLIAYIHVKISQQDWHGVADAAMDLREVDAKLQFISELNK